jgi:hypothetical protein
MEHHVYRALTSQAEEQPSLLRFPGFWSLGMEISYRTCN